MLFSKSNSDLKRPKLIQFDCHVPMRLGSDVHYNGIMKHNKVEIYVLRVFVLQIVSDSTISSTKALRRTGTSRNAKKKLEPISTEISCGCFLRS